MRNACSAHALTWGRRLLALRARLRGGGQHRHVLSGGGSRQARGVATVTPCAHEPLSCGGRQSRTDTPGLRGAAEVRWALVVVGSAAGVLWGV